MISDVLPDTVVKAQFQARHCWKVVKTLGGGTFSELWGCWDYPWRRLYLTGHCFLANGPSLSHTPARKPHHRDPVNSHVLDLTKLSWNVAFLLWSWLSQTFHYSKWIQDDPYKDVKWNENEETCILRIASYVPETSRTQDSSRRSISV